MVERWNGRPLEDWLLALDDPDDETRWRAVDAVRHLAGPAESVPRLIEALDDPYWRARALAAHALADLADDASTAPCVMPALGRLADALADESPHVRLNAAFALEALGPRAVAALPRLHDMAASDDEACREAARDAISRIDGG